MFCYQCEQTAKGTGCTIAGVCGKDAQTAALQDLLRFVTLGISMYAHRARKAGLKDQEIDRFIPEALFTTITNVNFDPHRLQELIVKASQLRDRARSLYLESCVQCGQAAEELAGPATLIPAASLEDLTRQGEEVNFKEKYGNLGDEIVGLWELIMYGLKGLAAYTDHARILGVEDDAIYAFFHKTLDYLTHDNHLPEQLLDLALKVGEINLKVMAMLDAANTGAYGHPEPTAVRVAPLKGKAILISGHDLKDLEELLKQTQGRGIKVYTHGEMLPLHGYPGLKRYPHLAGNYGSAWQNQQQEFKEFPGAILMTTNCLQRPTEAYKHRIFTTGLVAFPGVRHIADKNFEPVIQAALAEEGFPADAPAQTIMVGFGRNAVLSVADKVIAAVKSGAIRHFFLIGGCDGAKPGRNYYTRLAELVPKDCIILTLACGKYRFNKLEFGDIGGIPRLLDIGQCNDAYSAVQIALALAQAFDTDVNSLPLSLILSWYEQKAVVVLLSLLHLGLKNIRLGPSLPAFITPAVYNILKEKYNIIPITTPEEDLQAILG